MAKKKPPAAPAAGLASAPAPAGQQAGTDEGAEQGTTEPASASFEEAVGGAEGGQGDSQVVVEASTDSTQAGAESADDVELAQAGDAGEGDAAEPEQQYPIEDVLRNNGSGEFACRETGLLLSPGASRAVTIRDAEHLAVLAEAIEAFDRSQPRAGLLKFDGVAL